MGEFLRVWVPDHFRVALDRAVKRGEFVDDEEAVNVALADLLGVPGEPLGHESRPTEEARV